MKTIAFNLGMTVDLWMPYMLRLVLMTLTLMQGHSWSAKAKNQCCMHLATKQVISIKLATTVGHFLHDLDHDFTIVYMACSACLFSWVLLIPIFHLPVLTVQGFFGLAL